MKDGGPAFPTEIKIAQKVTREEREVLNGIVNTISMPGMSLRDYFAAKAMQGIISILHGGLRPVDLSKMAGDAYQIADAMIVAREVE